MSRARGVLGLGVPGRNSGASSREKYVRDLHILCFIGESVLLPGKNKMFLPTTVGTSLHLKTHQYVQTLRYWRSLLESVLSV